MELKERKRILVSAYACEPYKGSEPGVGWNWVLNLSKKYEVYVITRTNNRENIEKYLSENKICNIHFYYYDCSIIMKKIKTFPNGIFLYYKKWQYGIVPLAKEIIKKEKIELIHHITFNEYRTPGKLYKLNIPFVWGPIGGGQFYNSVFKKAYFSYMDIIKEKFRNLINILCVKFSKDIRNVINKAEAILIADQSTEKLMPKTRNYTRLLETAYDLDRNPIKQYTRKTENEKIQILWVGGIWPRKGLKVLIDALGKSDFNDYVLKIIGDGKDKKKCENLVKKYNLNNVEFVGKLSYNEVNECYDNSDIFIFTSLRDTSGNVVLEAMSHGVPVIALNQHGVGEIVTNDTGTLIDIISYEQIQEDLILAIKKYYNSYDLIITQGRNARKRIEKLYSWNHNIDVIENIYEKILHDK